MFEVVLTMAFILTLSIAATNMIRSTIDKRLALSQAAKVTHRLTYVMDKMADDLQHAFIVNSQRSEYFYDKRQTKTIFRNRLNSSSGELAFTTMTHRTLMANTPESDQTFIVYKLQDAKDRPGRKDLYRGESKVLPEDFDDEPDLLLFAKDIKSITVQGWRGDRWDKDRWDTERSDRRNMIPHMVRIEIEAWEEDYQPDVTSTNLEDITAKIKTVVYLPRSFGLKEPKDGSTTYKYF